MSTVAIKKTPVEASWDIKKVQEAAVRAFAFQGLSAMSALAKQGEQAMKDFQDTNHKYVSEQLKSIGVKTPMDLVKAKAEFETNVFGSKIEIEGDDNCAQLIYNQCAMWNAMQKYGNFTPEKQEKMGQHFQTCIKDFAKEFGMTGEVKMDGNTCTLTFRK